MTRINTAILLSLLVISCLKSGVQREIVPVNVPAEKCKVPKPLGVPGVSRVPYDCDGPGPETTVCMAEMDFVQIIVWMKKSIAWAEIIERCESIEFTDELEMVPPKLVRTPVEESRI